MAEDFGAKFAAALRHKLNQKTKTLSGQRITQRLLADKTGLSVQWVNAIIHERVIKGKVSRASREVEQDIAEVFGYSHSEFIRLGEMVLEGLPVQNGKTEIPLLPAPQRIEITGAPPQVANGFDTICAAATTLAATLQTLANQQRKEQERLEMWNEVFEMLPNPTLIVRNGIIEFQNKLSLIWGRITGGPLCGTCLDDQCDGDDCKLKEAMETHQETRTYKFIRDDFYKLIISQMRYGGLEYFIVSATEINECFEAFRDEDRRKHTERRKNPQPKGDEQ